MFTNFSQKLNQLFGIEGFPPEAAEVLISVLTQCNAPLEHRAEVTTPTSGTGASYAIALATWIRASGHGSYVNCRAASDPIGTLTSSSATFNVYLPRSNSDKDPCVYAGDILQYVEISGVKYAVGESYLSAKIGTLGELYHNDVPNGWAWCNGSGSTPDLRERFTQGAVDNTEIGDEGGTTTHAHDLSYTQLSVNVGVDDPADPNDIFFTVNLDGGGFCATGPVEFDSGAPINCDAAPAQDHLPPWTKVYKIIRVGPSGEIV